MHNQRNHRVTRVKMLSVNEWMRIRPLFFRIPPTIYVETVPNYWIYNVNFDLRWKAGRFAKLQKSVKSEIKPNTEISTVYKLTRCYTNLEFRCSLKFVYLLILNERDFKRFDSWQIVSSSIATVDASYNTRSGRIVYWNTWAIDWKMFESISTQRVLLWDLTPWIQFAITRSVLLCRILKRLREAEQLERTCLFVLFRSSHTDHNSNSLNFSIWQDWNWWATLATGLCEQTEKELGASCPSRDSICWWFCDICSRWWPLLKLLELRERSDSQLMLWRRIPDLWLHHKWFRFRPGLELFSSLNLLLTFSFSLISSIEGMPNPHTLLDIISTSLRHA